MSWHALAYVQRLRTHADGADLERSEKMLLFQVAYYHNEEKDFAWVSTGRLAQEGMTSMRQIQRLLRECARHGTLEIEARSFDDGKSAANTYRFPALDATFPSPTPTPVSPSLSDIQGKKSDTQVAESDIYDGAIRKNSTEQYEQEKTKPLPDSSSGGATPASDLIYRLYPRKIGPRKAKPAIIEALKRLVAGERGQPMTRRQAADFLAERVKLYAASPAAADPQFIPYPERWFKYSRYLDDEKEWQIRRHDGKHVGQRSNAVREARRRIERRAVGPTE